MGELVTLTGMILVASPVKDYDRRVEILTRERGRISAFAQGARRQGNPLSACTIPFTYGEFMLYAGRNSYNIKEGHIYKFFGDIAQDYDMLCYASYFSEMIQYLTRENVEAPQELLLLYVTVSALQTGKVPLRLIRLIFEIRLMYIQGEGMEVFRCLGCGKEDVYDIYFAKGGLICQECAKKDESLKESVPFTLSYDAKYALQYIIASSFEKLYTFDLSENVLYELEEFRRRYFARYLPHKFRTEEFL